MGRTVDELETSMSVREFHEWVALAAIDHEQQQGA